VKKSQYTLKVSIIMILFLITGCADESYINENDREYPLIYEFSTTQEKKLEIEVRPYSYFYISFPLNANQTYYLKKKDTTGSPTTDIVAESSKTSPVLTVFTGESMTFIATFSGLHYLRITPDTSGENNRLYFHIAESEADLDDFDFSDTGETGGSETSFGISSTYPNDGGTWSCSDCNIQVIFNKAVDLSSFTTNTADNTCSGTIMVSDVNFSTCIKMSSAPFIDNNNQTTVGLKPAANLVSGTTYKIRVLSSVKRSDGVELGSNWTSTNGFTIQ